MHIYRNRHRHAHAQTCTSTDMHMHRHRHAHLQTQTQTCTSTDMHIHRHRHAHLQTCTDTDTDMHMHRHRHRPAQDTSAFGAFGGGPTQGPKMVHLAPFQRRNYYRILALPKSQILDLPMGGVWLAFKAYLEMCIFEDCIADSGEFWRMIWYFWRVLANDLVLLANSGE